MTSYDAKQVGWRLGGRASLVGWSSGSLRPHGWCLWPAGVGEDAGHLDPGLVGRAGCCVVTLTKPEDFLLTLDERGSGKRPVRVLDLFDLVPGADELVWDPVAGCEDSMVAERRAKAFTAGTVKGTVSRGTGDVVARAVVSALRALATACHVRLEPFGCISAAYEKESAPDPYVSAGQGPLLFWWAILGLNQ